MLAYELSAIGPRLNIDYPIPQPAPGEALIQPRLVGICATDLAMINGYHMDFCGAFGHEFVGDVVEAPNAPEWVGRRVVGEISIGCDECAMCRRGLRKHCLARTCLGIIAKDGTFAERFTLPVANLHAVPEGVADHEAVFTEPLAAALEVLEQVRIRPTNRVYLLGAGKLGMLLGQVLALTGCDLTVIGRHARPLQMLEEWTGCQSVCVPAGEDNETALAELVANPADVVVEATGTEAGFAMSRRLVRAAGTIVLKSTFVGGATPLDLSRVVVDEVSILGSRCGPFIPALRLLNEGKIKTRPLISGCYDLKDIEKAMDHARKPGVLKVLVRP